mmetsp:Transcript_14270/g.41004  ORF Transcript_14270/g.41004 Transcript_14270/m.41004 type:complete len:85 (-) Transcript_14270:3388-3642(-)
MTLMMISQRQKRLQLRLQNSNREYGRWEGISRSACEEKCLKKIKNGKKCYGYDYNEQKDERCRVFYEYPFHKDSHNDVNCWLTD